MFLLSCSNILKQRQILHMWGLPEGSMGERNSQYGGHPLSTLYKKEKVPLRMYPQYIRREGSLTQETQPIQIGWATIITLGFQPAKYKTWICALRECHLLDEVASAEVEVLLVAHTCSAIPFWCNEFPPWARCVKCEWDFLTERECLDRILTWHYVRDNLLLSYFF